MSASQIFVHMVLISRKTIIYDRDPMIAPEYNVVTVLDDRKHLPTA